MNRRFVTPAAWLARATLRIHERDRVMSLQDAADLTAAIPKRVGWDNVPEVAVDSTFRLEWGAGDNARPPERGSADGRKSVSCSMKLRPVCCGCSRLQQLDIRCRRRTIRCTVT